MSKRVINIGSAPNDGQGESLRSGLNKVNQNFSELYDTLGDGVNVISYASTAGISTLAENLTGRPSIDVSGITNTGITTTQSVETTDLNVVGVVTATRYFGDGSQLTGVVGTGQGLDIFEDSVRRGIAKELNFAENIQVSSPDGRGRVNISVASSIISAGSGGGGGGSLEIRDENLTLGNVTILDYGSHLDVSPVSEGIATVSVRFPYETWDFSNITASHISNWDTAYGWGDHSVVGYLTSYTETYTLSSVVGRGNVTTDDVYIFNQLYFSNVWPTLAGLQTVDASQWHGMFAHAHDTGHGYFAHAGEWKQLLDTSSSILELGDTPSGPPDGGWEGAVLRYREAIGGWQQETPISLGISTSDIDNWNQAYNWGNPVNSGFISTDHTGNVSIAGTMTLTGEMLIDGYEPVLKLRDDNGLAAFGADTNYVYLEYNAEEGPAVYFRLRADTNTPTFRMQSEGGNFGLSNPLMQEMVTIQGGHPQNNSNWGYVGLNYPNPGERLHVNGNVKVVNGHFDGDGSQLINIPTSGINGLQGYVDGRVNALKFSGNYSDLVGRPTIPSSLNDLSNVSVPSPDPGQVLKWSGTEWVAAADVGGSGGAGIGYSDLSVTQNPAGIASLSYSSATGVFVYTPPDLTGYATTTSITGFASEGYVNNALLGYATTESIVGFITSGALVGYATITYVNNYVDTQIGIKTFSGSYVDLRDKPFIPSDTLDLTNGAGYVTAGIIVGLAQTSDIANLEASKVNRAGDLITGGLQINGITTANSDLFVTGDLTVSGISTFVQGVQFLQDAEFENVLINNINGRPEFDITVTPDGSQNRKFIIAGVTSASGSITAPSFIGDGSQLTGVAASNVSIPVREEGTLVGSAVTLNFVGAGVTATVNGGVATIEISDTGELTGITSTQIANWDTAYGWGDHGIEGYLVATLQDKTNWDTTYGWGDHRLGFTVFSSGSASGIITAITFDGNATTATYATNTGVATYASNAGVATVATDLTGSPYINVGGVNAPSGIITAASFNNSGGGTANLDSPNTLNINAPLVAISTDLNVGSTLRVGVITATTDTRFKSDVVFETNAYFGAGEHLRIWNDGSNSIIGDVGAGDLHLTSQGNAIKILKSGSTDEPMAVFNTDGSSELYHNNLKKLETTSSGVTVTGTLTASTVSGSFQGNLTGTASEANALNNSAEITAANFRTNDTVGDGSDVGFAIKYVVTSNGASSYRFSGPGLVNTTDNPTFYLQRGFTYIFENTTGTAHPFRIQFPGTITGVGTYVSGSQTGTQVFTVPFDAPSSYQYQCTIHGGMLGTFNVA